MYELIQLTEHDYYIDCPAKIGLVKTGDDEAVLIDSGSDKDAGKRSTASSRLRDGNCGQYSTPIPMRITSAGIVFCRRKRVAGYMQREWNAYIPTCPCWSR